MCLLSFGLMLDKVCSPGAPEGLPTESVGRPAHSVRTWAGARRAAAAEAFVAESARSRPSSPLQSDACLSLQRPELHSNSGGCVVVAADEEEVKDPSRHRCWPHRRAALWRLCLHFCLCYACCASCVLRWTAFRRQPARMEARIPSVVPIREQIARETSGFVTCDPA